MADERLKAGEASPAGSFSPEELLGPLNDLEHLKAPKLLYVQGRRDLLRRSPRVSVVGSRKASEAGLKRAAKLARFLAEQGAVVVSGLAEGIDTAAHRAAMDAGGHTIAVLGTPLNRVYPPQNVRLQIEIGEKHLLVSEFQRGTPPTKDVFARRNRTMALVSNASVIIEAGERSGTRHQGWEALRLGRPLFLLRSLLASPGLTWPEEMLKYGAQVLEEAEGILDFLPAPSTEGERPTSVAF